MGKRRFMGEVVSNESMHNASRLSNSRIDTHTRGWNLGVKVVAEPVWENGVRTDRNHFTVFVTGGSHDETTKGVIAEVWEEKDGSIQTHGFTINVNPKEY